METRTVSQKRLPTSRGIRQFPDKEGYQGRIFLGMLLKRGTGKWKTGTKPNLNTFQPDRINRSKETNSRDRPFLRKNFHSDRDSRLKFPDNSPQWKALQVCLCHLFKIRTIWGQIREAAGPICSFAEISAPSVNITKFNFHTRSQGSQGCSTLWLHDNRDSPANWQRDPTRIM